MGVKVFIPTPLRPYTDKHAIVEVGGNSVDEIMKNLASRYEQVRRHLYDENGNLRSYVNIYRNDEDIRYLQHGGTPVKDTDTISIVPSIAGGVDVGTPPASTDTQLSHEEILRYSRHLIIPEVGMEGQKRLKSSRVLIIGAGGLGSPASMYLAAAGVGTIGMVDFDTVDPTNLQRQILHSTDDVGRSKLDSARETLNGINPHVEVVTHKIHLTSDNALPLLADYDVIVDGTDNFPTRYLVNDACVLLGKPNVYGSIFRFEGQVSVFYAQEGPCYRCLYPSPPPPGLVPSCAEGGVLGVLPGIIGSLQAIEAIKLIIHRGDSLVGRLVLFDALHLGFRELKLKKDPACPVCGEHPTIRALIDYEQFCGIDHDAYGPRNDQITVEDLKSRIDRHDDVFILDVREPHEYEIVNMGGYLIPPHDLPGRVHELDSSRDIVVHCKVGSRSSRAVAFLKQSGFRKVKNLVGGIDAWAARIDESLPRY